MKPNGGKGFPVPTDEFPVPDAPGICIQHVGIATRIDVWNGPNGGEFANLPVIFPVVREFPDRRRRPQVA